MAWLTLHVFYVLLGTWLTHRSLLKGIGVVWLIQDVGIPFMLSIIVGLMGKRYVAQSEEYSVYVKLISGGGLVLIACALSILVSRQLRSIVLSGFGWKTT